MRIVSYTRTTSSYPGAEIPSDTITCQNKLIKEYASNHGWSISGRYSDRKKDNQTNEAFEQLLQDGLRRKFDAVIVDSVYHAGKDLWRAKEVLLNTFHFAGISFVIVEDDFISIGKTNEEAEAYFEKKYGEMRAENIRVRVNRRNRKGVLSWNDLKYGYKLTEDYKLVVDPETAPVVRRMFELCAGGRTPAEIADIFQEEKIPRPLVSRGMNVKINDPYKWDRLSVRRLLDKTVYIGHWTKVVQGEKMYFYNDPIVEEDTFQKVQEYLASIATHAAPPRPRHRYTMLVYDKDNGLAFLCRKDRLGFDYLIFKARPKGYEGERRILLKDLDKNVREKLSQEKDLAMYLAGIISAEGENRKAVLLEKMREEYIRRSFLIADVAENRMSLYRLCEAGEACQEDLKEAEAELQRITEKIEPTLKDYPEEVEKISLAYSTENPWIKQMLEWDEEMELDKPTLNRFISKIVLDHMEVYSIDLKLQEWRDMLPEEWRERCLEKAGEIQK